MTEEAVCCSAGAAPDDEAEDADADAVAGKDAGKDEEADAEAETDREVAREEQARPFYRYGLDPTIAGG